MSDPGARLNLGRCSDCGRVRYETRAKARRAARTRHRGNRMRAYQCGDYWHLGHLATERGTSESVETMKHDQEGSPRV